MRTIYIDSDFKCHLTDGEGLTAVETKFFDGKCDAFIEGYRFVPAGESWTNEDGETFEIRVDGAFLAVGLEPRNGPFAHLAKTNDWGYFDSGEDCLTQTPGLFVAGDCRSKRIRQVVTAAGDGAVAAMAACSYLDQNN